MYLRDLTVHADDAIVDRYKAGFVQRFHREACSVVESYLAEIYRKVVTGCTAKVGFTFTDETDELPHHSLQRHFYPWPFDFAAYTASSTNAKQRLVLDALQEALIWIARREEWDIDPFYAAYKAIIDRNFEFVGYSQKSWMCPRKQFRARLFFNWHLGGIDLYAVLFHNRSKTELARLPLGTGVPMAGILHEYLNAGKWESNTKFVVAASTPIRKTWIVDFAGPITTNAT